MTDLRDQLQSTLGDAYTIERELGGGGMSRVFLATERALNRKVVIKVLPGEMAGAVSIERFKREINVAARLQQANIVPVLSAGDMDGLPYFVMPFVEGESLRARLSSGGELPIPEAVGILKEVARALTYAHDQGVVHRDIKPDNVLLSGGTAMVTDFGVAKALTAATTEGGRGMTGTGVTIGTPAYMAPEQASADPKVDHRADIYAFGCLAYELLSGAAPFAGRSPQAMMAAHATEHPDRIDRRRAGVQHALAELVMRCLEKRPADRPQSATDVLRALDAVATPTTGVGGWHSVSGNSASRTRVVVGSSILAIVILAGVYALFKSRTSPTAEKTVAVLPATTVGNDTAQAWFAAGMTDEITTALTRVPGLIVTSYSRAAGFKNQSKDARGFGKELGVATIVESEVFRATDRLRVSVHLTSVADGHVLWSDSYTRDAKDLFAVQDSIARAIASALQVRLRIGARALVAPGTTNLEAHDVFLKAKFHHDIFTKASLRTAIALYDSAARLDLGYALPYTGMALAWWNLGDDFIAPSAAMPNMRAAALKALHRDSTSSRAHALLAETDWPADTGALRREIEIALRTGSDDALTVFVAGFVLAVYDTPRGLELHRRVSEMEPTNTNWRAWVAYMLNVAGRGGDARREIETVLRLAPTDHFAHFVRGEILMAAGDAAAALTDYEAALTEFKAGGRAGKGRALAVLGRKAEARLVAAELEAERAKGQEYVSADFIAGIYAALGDGDAAFKLLDRAFADRSSYLEAFAMNPVWIPLRGDPRYALFVRKLNVPIP
jgi:serine/threonine-protein kinase